jgi:rhodanese-related sulfurtransferase
MKITYVNVVEASSLLEIKPTLAIIDVRTGEEFEMSYIENAVNYDVQGEFFKDQLSGLDREKDYLIHCHSGQRSTDALQVFKELGFKHIYHMDGGMREWAHAELPTVYNWFI